jgi:glucose-6-phosphate 1-dehydrogenase
MPSAGRWLKQQPSAQHLTPMSTFMSSADTTPARHGGARPSDAVICTWSEMHFSYADHFGGSQTTGYERLLYDCMIGDQTLFQRADMVEAGWSLIQPILDVWSALPVRNFPNYKSGSWGPSEGDELLARDGRSWGKPSLEGHRNKE